MATLPGLQTTILDRFYNLGRTDLPGGPIIALIAKRGDGTDDNADSPNYEAYYTNSEQEIIEQYGEDSYIHRAFYEATTAGASRVICIPLPSDTDFDHSNATLSSSMTTSEDPTADPFDLVFASAEAARADIIVAWGRGTDSDNWGSSEGDATPDSDDNDDFFYADNSSTAGSSWVSKIAAKCASITSNSYPCFAVIGVKGISSGYEIPRTSDVSAGLAFPNLASKEGITSGHFVSVVATEVRPLSYPSSWGWANGAATYAALVARLDASSATTGKPAYNVDRVRYRPTRAQSEALNGLGLVTVAFDFENQAKWVDGITFGKDVSDFTRLTTLRIAFDAVKMVLTVGDKYKGESMSIQAQNAFETELNSKMQAMQRAGALITSDFMITYVPSENKALIDLYLTPAFELREIVLKLAINF